MPKHSYKKKSTKKRSTKKKSTWLSKLLPSPDTKSSLWRMMEPKSDLNVWLMEGMAKAGPSKARDKIQKKKPVAKGKNSSDLATGFHTGGYWTRLMDKAKQDFDKDLLVKKKKK